MMEDFYPLHLARLSQHWFIIDTFRNEARPDYDYRRPSSCVDGRDPVVVSSCSCDEECCCVECCGSCFWLSSFSFVVDLSEYPPSWIKCETILRRIHDMCCLCLYFQIQLCKNVLPLLCSVLDFLLITSLLFWVSQCLYDVW